MKKNLYIYILLITMLFSCKPQENFNYMKNIEDIAVNNYSIENIPEDSDVIVVHKNLVGRTEMSHKGKKIIAITNYLNDPNIEELLENIKESRKK